MAWINPNIAYLRQGKTRKSASAAGGLHRFGQDEAYLTVREVLSGTSTAADGALSSERSGYYRCRYATLGLTSAPHLCQPDGRKSCAWCCGLYNVHHAGRDALIRKLWTRTAGFAATERTVAAIQHFSEKTKREEQAQYLDPDFYSCEFIGFLDDLETRVGCMLHPLARGNMGIDWRGLSFHGAMACKGFFCRSFRQLSSAESSVILGAIQDWYLYGLAISDASYAKSFFLLAAEKLGQVIDLAKLLAPPASELVHEFFHWKISWPYRNRNSITRGFNRPEPPAAGTLAGRIPHEDLVPLWI